MIAVGIAVATISVARTLSKKQSVTMTTRRMPSKISFDTSRTADPINRELSLTVTMLISAGVSV